MVYGDKVTNKYRNNKIIKNLFSFINQFIINF